MSGTKMLRTTFAEEHERLREKAKEYGLGTMVQIYPIFPDEMVGKRKYRRMDECIYRMQQRALKRFNELGIRTSTVEAMVAGYMAELLDAELARVGEPKMGWDWEELLESFRRTKEDPQYKEGLKGPRTPIPRKLIDSAGVPVALKPTKGEIECQ